MREKAKQSFAEFGGTVRSMSAPIGSMSGGQRQQVAIARAISWADKVVILDEPTAALGVVQTQNVLDSIKRVKAKGIAVILISHSMPHVLEVADRVQVLRLGRRVATFDASKTTVEELGWRHDRRPGQERRSGMSVIHPPEDVAVVDTHEGQQSLLKRLSNTQSVWILGVLVVIVAFFSVAAGGKFLSASNFSLISQNVAVWAVLGVGMTFVIITSGIDLSIGSVLVFSSVVAAKVMEAVGGQGWGTALIGILAALVSGVIWGMINGYPRGQGQDPGADRHPRHPVGGSGARPGHHGRDRRAVGARGDDGLQHLRQDPRHPVAALHRPDRPHHRRHPAAQHEVRPLHLRGRLQRGGSPSRRRQGRPAPDPIYALSGTLAGFAERCRWPSSARPPSPASP